MSVIQLKICGIQTPREAVSLVSAGVHYLGLNFIPTSKRCISLETAQSIVAAVGSEAVQLIALFQDQPLAMVQDYAEQIGVDGVQLHGSESPDYVGRLDQKVYKAISANPRTSTDEVIALMRTYPDVYFILDRYRQGEGDRVKFELAQQAIAAFPDKILLAGGLTTDNLQNVISQIRPYGIDIASGVRSAEGVLDMGKVREVLTLLKS